MQNATSSGEQRPVGGSIVSIEQTFAFKRLAKGLVVSPEESSTSPFIVLMGWVNCGDKYLAKYSDLLSKLGCSSVRSVQPALTGFSIAEAPRRLWASNILDFLLETNTTFNRPIIFWAFSNGGCWVFEQLLPLLQNDRYKPIRNAVAGLIFDSAPCFMTPTTGSLALTAGLTFPLKQLLQALFLLTVPLLLLFNVPKRFWRRMLEEELPVPRLYYYSTDDELCCAQELEALLKRKKEHFGYRAAIETVFETCLDNCQHLLESMPQEYQENDIRRHLDITIKKWDHSAHCAHLRSYREEYVAALQAFLAKVTKANKDQAPCHPKV